MTAELVRLQQRVRRSYAEPYIKRAQTRMRAVFMASCLWSLFFGWIFGEYVASGYFPWGTLAWAVGYSVFAIVLYRRNRD